MKKWACALCLLLFSLGYLAAFLPGVPLLKYYPAAHTWTFDTADGPAMKWFSKLAYGVVAGLAGWIIGSLVERNERLKDGHLAIAEYSAWAAALACACIIATREWLAWM